jgi:uncharacterized NAD(P)/FAD-binding protein YdhS
MSSSFDIAVIGGGFGGLMVVANAVRKNKNLRILWISDIPHGRGLAYSTRESCHLLNVTAARMSAYAADSGHFLAWLEEKYPGKFSAGSYVPRMIFGEYLDSIRHETISNGNVTIVTDTAIAASSGWDIKTKSGKNFSARHLVIATGNPAIGDLKWPDNENYISDFWRWRLGGNHLPSGDHKDKTIVLAGTGLTAADAVLSLRRDGFAGTIIAASPHSHFPLVHRDPYPPCETGEKLVKELKNNPTALSYLRAFRAHAPKNKDENNWRGAVQSVRDHVVDLWQALDEKQKKKFMRRLWSFWNIHRHRMAPEVAAEISNVKTLKGFVLNPKPDGTVTVGKKQIKAFRVVNCTGPSYAAMTRDNSLLASLIKDKHLAIGPLGLGVATPDNKTLHVIGTPLLGERLETTAVPELREQAAEISKKI